MLLPKIISHTHLVLATSKGPVAQGPSRAAKKPEVIDCPGVSCFPSPSCLSHRKVSSVGLAQKRHLDVTANYRFKIEELMFPTEETVSSFH